MENLQQNQELTIQTIDQVPFSYLEEEVGFLKAMLSYGLNISENEIKVSFPTLKNFYLFNNVYKSSWSIYLYKEQLPLLLYTGNFLLQGGQYGKRSERSPFGAKALSSLTSLANTFSMEASFFKQNWALDLNLLEEENSKLLFSVQEYKEFLRLLNKIRAQCLLHLSEERNIDFVISEFSEPSDPLFFMDLDELDSQATRVKTYFKPISQKALNLFQKLSANTEFEGKFFNLQPGTWLKDDVLIELEKFYSEKFFEGEKIEIKIEDVENDYNFNNPFKIQALKPSY